MNITRFFLYCRVILLVGLATGSTLCMMAPMVTAGDRVPGGSAATAPEVLAVPRDEISLAGGAIRFTSPRGWFVSELPAGRHLQVWVTAQPLARRGPHDGVAVSFHWLGRPASHEELRSWALRSDEAGRAGQRPGQNVELREIAGRPGVVTSFANDDRRAEHFVVGLETGIFELISTASPAQFVAQQKITALILDGLRLQSPQLANRPADLNAIAAADAIGLWKSLRGQLHLGRDGGILLRFDRRVGFPLDAEGVLRFDAARTEIDGRFQAQGDLLMVTWSDGSRTIFRWRMNDGQLLLTDHHGRVSQLNRLLE